MAPIRVAGAILGLLAAAATTRCTDSVTPATPSAVTLQEANAGAILVTLGATWQLHAVVLSDHGDTLTRETVTWASSNPHVATVSDAGLVLAVANGTAEVTVHLGALNSPPFHVTVSQEVASLRKTSGDSQTQTVGDVLPAAIGVQVVDGGGRPIAGATVTFEVTQGGGGVDASSVTTTDDGHATVTWTLGTVALSQQLTARAQKIQFVNHPTPPGGPSEYSVTFNATALGLEFAAVSAGQEFSCGLTTSGAAYCWGRGYVVNGSATNRSPVLVPGDFAFSALAPGPTSLHVCGLATSGAAYCWGDNAFGQLGDGSTTGSLLPVAVSGNIRFNALVTGQNYTCGLANGMAYCWGRNDLGQLGNGSTTSALVPVAVSGDQPFRSIAAGVAHTCALTTSGTAHCWGLNDFGQLGDGSRTSSPVPVAVSGGLTFSALVTGSVHTCGLDTSGLVSCWGVNGWGQLGIGSRTGPETCFHGGPHPPLWPGDACSTVPVRGANAVLLAFITAGGHHTCGATPAGVGYCWGANHWGELGDGSEVTTATPVAVSGGFTFARIATGSSHTCGMTNIGAVCWGANWAGQLGDGTTTNSSVPVKVTGQP